MWIRKREYETLIGRYRSAVAAEQGKVEALRKMLDTCEEQLSDAHREVGHLEETIRNLREQRGLA